MPRDLGITCIHVCDFPGCDGIYVERNGVWYRVVVPGATHAFAEVANWPEQEWERRRRDPPCGGEEGDDAA